MNEILPDPPWFKDCWCSLHKNKKGKGSYMVWKTKHRTEKRCRVFSTIFSKVPLPEKIKINSITRIISVAKFLLVKGFIWRFLPILVFKNITFIITYLFTDWKQGLLKTRRSHLFTKERQKTEAFWGFLIRISMQKKMF